MRQCNDVVDAMNDLVSELSQARAAVLQRIETAKAQRPNFQGLVAPQLLAVSKTFPMQAVVALAQSGQVDFGENYVQEGIEKIKACRLLRPELRFCWHFIGPLQSNKTREVAEHFDWVHSVDRLKIAQRLDAQRPKALGALQCFIQVNISDESSKSGVRPDEVKALALAMTALKQLRLRGLMAIPEASADPEVQHRAFHALRNCLVETNLALGPDFKLDQLSMGMSSDLEAAVMEGSSWLRVGTAIFGQRTSQAS